MSKELARELARIARLLKADDRDTLKKLIKLVDQQMRNTQTLAKRARDAERKMAQTKIALRGNFERLTDLMNVDFNTLSQGILEDETASEDLQDLSNEQQESFDTNYSKVRTTLSMMNKSMGDDEADVGQLALDADTIAGELDNLADNIERLYRGMPSDLDW